MKAAEIVNKVWDCRRRMQDDQRKERDYMARE